MQVTADFLNLLKMKTRNSMSTRDRKTRKGKHSRGKTFKDVMNEKELEQDSRRSFKKPSKMGKSTQEVTKSLEKISTDCVSRMEMGN